jgi:hypothetical protein
MFVTFIELHHTITSSVLCDEERKRWTAAQMSEIEGARFSDGEREGLWLCEIQRTARDTKK